MYSDVHVTLVGLATAVLVELTSKYKKAMGCVFPRRTENGELCNRYTTWEELTSEMKGKTQPSTILSAPSTSPSPLPALVD